MTLHPSPKPSPKSPKEKRQPPRTPPKKRNSARRKREYARCFHSPERVLWVRSLPCAACGKPGWCDNAHTVNGGRGRKADYTTIAPLCGDFASSPLPGCHTRYDQHLSPFNKPVERERIKAAAVETEAKWQAHVAESGQ